MTRRSPNPALPAAPLRLLEAALLALPGVTRERSRFSPQMAFHCRGKEFAHVHDSREIDVRVTGPVLRRYADELKDEVCALPRRGASDWVAFRLRNRKDAVRLVVWLRRAWEAHRGKREL